MFESGTNGRSPQIDWLELLNTVTNFILFNLLWLFGSLLIVTIPVMTAALFASVAPLARKQTLSSPLADFWTAVRRYWRKATVIGMIDLVLGGFIVSNLFLIRQMGFEQFFALPAFVLTILPGSFLILVNIYIWPLLVTLDQPLRSLLKNGLRLAIVHPFWGGAVALAALILLVISLTLPRFVLLTITFSAVALITYWGTWQVMQRYLDEDDLKRLGFEQKTQAKDAVNDEQT